MYLVSVDAKDRSNIMKIQPKKLVKMPKFDNRPEVSPNNQRSFHSVCRSGSCSYWGPTSDTGTYMAPLGNPTNLLRYKWKISLANRPSDRELNSLTPNLITSYWGQINVNSKFGAKIAVQILQSNSEWPKVCFHFRPTLNIWPENYLALSRSQNRKSSLTMGFQRGIDFNPVQCVL